MDKKTVLITGAASGIGKAVAFRFATAGYYVGLYDIDIENLQEVQKAIGDERSCYKELDVVIPDQVSAVLDHFSSNTNGRLDVLFSSAGIMPLSPFDEIDLATHHRTLEINNQGILNCCYLAFDLLKQTEDSRVINMSSASAIYGTPDLASYSASKFWVRGFTEALNIEWRQHDIWVCDVMPHFVDTPLVHNAIKTDILTNSGVDLTAHEVAEVVFKAANNKRIHWPVGISVKAGLQAPRPVMHFVMKRLSGY